MDNDTPEELKACRERFLAEFVQLKADACYIRDYRNYYGKWVTAIGTVRAVTSVASIGGWLVDSHLSWLWASLLLTGQVAQALKSTYPYARKRAALSRWTRRLNEIVLTAQTTWDDIEDKQLTAGEIRKSIKIMRTQQLSAQARAIPDGLPRKTILARQAQAETALFF